MKQLALFKAERNCQFSFEEYKSHLTKDRGHLPAAGDIILIHDCGLLHGNGVNSGVVLQALGGWKVRICRGSSSMQL